MPAVSICFPSLQLSLALSLSLISFLLYTCGCCCCCRHFPHSVSRAPALSLVHSQSEKPLNQLCSFLWSLFLDYLLFLCSAMPMFNFCYPIRLFSDPTTALWLYSNSTQKDNQKAGQKTRRMRTGDDSLGVSATLLKTFIQFSVFYGRLLEGSVPHDLFFPLLYHSTP